MATRPCNVPSIVGLRRGSKTRVPGRPQEPDPELRALTLALCLLIGAVIVQLPGGASATSAPKADMAHKAMTMGADMACPACDAMGSTSPTRACHADSAPCAATSVCGALAILGAELSPSPRQGGFLLRPALMTIAGQSACVPEPPPPRA